MSVVIYVWEPSEKRVLTGSGLESIRLEEKHKAVLVPASPQDEDEGRERLGGWGALLWTKGRCGGLCVSGLCMSG